MAANLKTISGHSQIIPSIHNIARALNKIHKDKNITVNVNGDEGQFIFKGEVNDFEEMAGNLMENAAKWAASEIIIDVSRDDHWITIEICDDGPGIDIKARDAVFDRGERLDENIPGSGLGLSIVRDLADLYGGEIKLQDNDSSNPCDGLKASLILPVI